jgi:plastocyanin
MRSAQDGLTLRSGWRLWYRALPCLVLVAASLAGTAASANAADKSRVHTVLIDGMKFSPQTLEVNAGDTVVWRNKAKTKGTMPYFCKLHTTMKGVLIVK